MVVQARNEPVVLAARVHKGFPRLHVDLFQGLDAIAGKAGAHDVHTLQPLLGHLHQGGLGVRLQPLGLAKARLEGEHILRIAQIQSLRQQAACGQAFVAVGVAQLVGALRYAVKTEHQLLRPAVFTPVFLYGLGQRVDVAGVVVVALDKAQLRNVALRFGPVIHGIAHAGGGGA